jgi:UDP-N-acetylmuramate--alanine ligase
MNLVPGQHIHLVGIGGFGLSAIARVLLQQGFMVSGSDRNLNALTAALKREGATIYKGHDPVYVVGAEMVVISSAIPIDNIEVLAAQAQGIPVYKRADVIGAIMSGHYGIAIAGTHGKTTTTAMTTHILMETGQNPSYILGGILRNTGHNADIGGGRVFVIEADEYDNMFHGLRPQVGVITNIEWDHPDFFRTPHEMVESFSHFVGLLPREGLLVVCADDPTA